MIVVILWLLILPIVGITHLICWSIRWSKRAGRSDLYISRLRNYIIMVFVYLCGGGILYLLSTLGLNTQNRIYPIYLTVVPAILPIYYWWKIASMPWDKEKNKADELSDVIELKS